MEKQHFTTKVARLVNPPLVSHFKKVQQDYLESIYASKKAPVGRGKPPTIPKEARKKRFGIHTNDGESAISAIHPSNIRVTRSTYANEFLPPLYSSYPEEVSPAGVKMKGYDLSGERMKKILNPNANTESSIIVPISNSCEENKSKERNTEYKSHYIPFHCDDGHKYLSTLTGEKHADNQTNLLNALKNILSIKKSYHLKDFSSFIKSYLQSYPECITLADLQEIIENFGYCVPLNVLQKLLIDCDVIKNEEEIINVQKLIYSLNPLSFPPQIQTTFSFSDDTTMDFKTTSADIGDHRYTVPKKTAGVPHFRTDIKKPKLKSVADSTEYGDITSGSLILQPSIFEKYGVYEEDLKVPRSKEEIISILQASGIRFWNEMFEVVWEKVNTREKANIGTVWNALKYLCLTENKKKF